MASPKVIIFGPTGAVGSATVRTAADLGAEVVLAMRDKSKAIPGLDAQAEKQGRFSRVEADLTKPDTVHSAVQTTNAENAFLYVAHGLPDHMRATVEALKKAGIKQVVLLSSFTVQGDPKDVEPSEMIAFAHAAVEQHLLEVFGPEGYIAVRAGSFASSFLQYAEGIKSGDVKIHQGNATVDSIASDDIGRVCGTALVKGPPHGERILYCYGPQILSHDEAVRKIAKAVGKEIKITPLTDDELRNLLTEVRKVPAAFADYIVRSSQSALEVQGLRVWGVKVSEEELSNVTKYTGSKATTFEDWIEMNKDKFT